MSDSEEWDVTQIQELEKMVSSPLTEHAESEEWETPAGPTEAPLTVRAERAAFIYQGSGDPHWRGQACHLSALADADCHEWVVIMACGCRASVPSWTLGSPRESDIKVTGACAEKRSRPEAERSSR